MKKFFALLLSVAVLVPTLVVALDYSDATRRYGDADRFSAAEAAGISALTNWGVLEGNPDGNFYPGRTLNRAEFAKIVALLSGEDAHTLGAMDCFPDVRRQWFAVFVCFLKDQDAVHGNPDGLYHPERPVNYVEAAKILGEVFGYLLDHNAGDQWYDPYLRAASAHGTGLPLEPGHALMRGQMARLAAAFLAESHGELALYRAAERGETIRSSSSRSSARSSARSSSMSSTSSTSSAGGSSLSGASSSRAAELPDLPVRSHFLVLGERSEPIAGVKLFAELEAVLIRNAEVRFDRKLTSIDLLFLIDENGVEIGTLALDKLFDSTEKTWRGTFSASAYRLPKGQQRVIAVEARMKPRDGGGSSDQLVMVDSFKIGADGEDSTNAYNVNSSEIVFPQHQTAQARITSVQNTMAAAEALPLGNDQVVAAFAFAGTHVSGADLRLTNLTFQISKSADVTVSGWEIGTSETSERYGCSVSGDTVSCTSIPAQYGTIGSGSRTLRLYADVSLASGAQSPFLQITLNQPGSVGVDGAIHWTDGSGTFVWTELGAPIARGTRFE